MASISSDNHPSEAHLLWFQTGERPSDADFVPSKGELFYFRHEAIESAIQDAVLGTHPKGCDPWIKCSEGILDKDEIKKRFDTLQELQDAKGS